MITVQCGEKWEEGTVAPLKFGAMIKKPNW